MTFRALQWAAPFLLAAHYPLFMFAGNVAFVRAPETYFAIAATLFLAILMVAGLHAITRNRARTVTLVAGAVFWCFWYQVFAGAVAYCCELGPHADGSAAVALVPWTALWLLYLVVVTRARSLELPARMCLMASLILVAAPVATVAAFVTNGRGESVPPLPPVSLQAAATPPDIFYVIFDQYAGNGTLRDRYDFDNTALAEALRARGFVVASRSNANYFKTGLSLAATLNHTYLNDLFAGHGATSDWRPLYQLLENHRVWQALKPLGYDYVHLGSYWEPTRHNRHASENRSYAPLSYFSHSLYMRTPLYEMGLTMGGLLDLRRQQWHRIHRQLEDLAEIRARPRPVFVFVHFLLPHRLHVFGPGGEFLAPEVITRHTFREHYVNRVRFANLAMLRIIDAIFANTAKPKPIVIVQADEGPYPERYAARQRDFDWREATGEELREKFGILNAMHLPGVPPQEVESSLSPVNTFRLVFNEYFGAGLELLPDRSFVSVGDTKPYDFIDVTDVVSAGPVRESALRAGARR